MGRMGTAAAILFCAAILLFWIGLAALVQLLGLA